MSGALHPGGLEEHSPETAEGGCRGSEGSLWEGNEQRLQDLADDLNALEHRKAANTIERFLPGLMSCTAFPKQHGKRIRTTKMMERVNRGLRRRTRVAGVFPKEEYFLRRVGSIPVEINEEWVTGRRYLTMEKE